MFETAEQLRANAARQEVPEATRSHSWPSFAHPAPLTNEQLRMLSDKARELSRPLTDAERNVLLGAKAPQPRVTGVHVLEVS